ncbi:hypothetical protein GCM10011505_50180 [Tistrella bauzanensis]|uniref:Transposase n=1 Tax=Tistrella bauzanensis TaxID=657419 RepID=A0ABQ1JBY7_9PROT|nr:hypothetical protein GCM10011505_50180 [Tistrella bauzanensis]
MREWDAGILRYVGLMFGIAFDRACSDQLAILVKESQQVRLCNPT